jgi:hypothetical protein
VVSAASFPNIHTHEVSMTVYRNNCRLCGGQLYIVSGEFEASPMPLQRDGFSFTETKHLVTDLPEGGVMNICSAKTAGTKVFDEHPSKQQLIELGVLDEVGS